jgi:hypothetical protein
MRKYSRLLLSQLILAAAAVGAYEGSAALQHSLLTYQSPLNVVQVAPGEPLPRQTQRVVLVVIGGLGQAVPTSGDMPNMEALLEASASAPMVSYPPTYPSPAWTTLLTGVRPELNNALLLEPGTAQARPIAFDNLFAAAHDAGLPTAMTGFEDWRALLPAESIDASFYTSSQDATGDGQVTQAALSFIANGQYDLILIYFSQLAAAGQENGTESAAYAGAARQVDDHVRQILRLVDLTNSVVIVTSDHGLLENGRLGGSEPELTQLPFVMIGRPVVPGVYSPVQQVDLAPTAAALLGARLPAATQGRPLYEMLQLDQETLTRGQLQVAAQKVALGNAYLRVMEESGLSQASQQDLISAQQAFAAGNQAGALALAKLVSEEASAEMEAARMERIAREKLPRLGFVVAGLLLSLIYFWGSRRRANYLVSFMAASVTLASFYGLYRLNGYSLSLSSIDAIDLLLAALVRYAAIGLAGGGLALLVGLFYRDERQWWAALVAGYDCGLFITFLSALPVLVGYWQHGATLIWYLPDLPFVLLHWVALAQVAVVALLAIALPWPVALIVWAVGRWRTYSEARVRAWDSMARLRRR